jgi:hypothetical protein
MKRTRKTTSPKKARKLSAKKDFKYLDVNEDTVFLDRLGNLLQKGDVIGYANAGIINIGVFVGPAEHVKSRLVRNSTPYSYNSSRHKYYDHKYYDMEYTLKTDLVFLTLNKSTDPKKQNKEVKHYLSFQNNKVNKYAKLCLIQKPTFYADDRDVIGALMIIDDLIEKGILKSEKEEHKFLDSNNIENHTDLLGKEDESIAEPENDNENVPNDT